MDEATQMNWKTFTIRLIEALRWPVAFVATCFIFREPVTRFLHALIPGAHG
ncbi:hypothetical protein [Sphingomonas sp.]|uniref:hypothetical protein n=1 Tax=Sphingomonas sp. TaxID=28214 RepID=UPI003CC609BF